jgi:predicted O-methyltransferase YrrM
MAPKSFLLDQTLSDYMEAHNPPIDGVLRDLINETAQLGSVAGMQIAPEQGAFMSLLAKLTGARHAVEVGTFTGYSALCIARAMGAEGHLLCCDVSEEWTAIARRYWQRAGVADRIELKLAPALQTLQALSADRIIDLAFIDADKGGYIGYYEELVARMRPGGLIVVDNVLWSGRVADAADQEENTVAIRAFNDHLHADARVEAVILPISDGLTLARAQA